MLHIYYSMHNIYNITFVLYITLSEKLVTYAEGVM